MAVCSTEVNRARFLAANLFLYLCLNMVYEGKGKGGKSEDGGNLISAGGKWIFSSMQCWKQDTKQMLWLNNA